MTKNRKHIRLLSTDDNSLIDKIHFNSDKVNGELFSECIDLVSNWAKETKKDFTTDVFWELS